MAKELHGFKEQIVTAGKSTTRLFCSYNGKDSVTNESRQNRLTLIVAYFLYAENLTPRNDKWNIAPENRQLTWCMAYIFWREALVTAETGKEVQKPASLVPILLQSSKLVKYRQRPSTEFLKLLNGCP